MSDYPDMTLRLLVALVCGGLIGLERSYHARPAGFRTHTLVCLASAVLMLVTVYEEQWFVMRGSGRVAIDPTRMAQGIMTGIGFLGAGVIMKEGLSVRGLTTAASIWITSAIGILVGIGFYYPAGLALALTLGTLSAFRWIEAKIPSQQYAEFVVTFGRHAAMSEKELRQLVTSLHFTIANLHYRLVDGGTQFEYRMMLRTQQADSLRHLSDALLATDVVNEFQISPTGD
jgi:putative Mg2+ transporter-C (MgtC) family protein